MLRTPRSFRSASVHVGVVALALMGPATASAQAGSGPMPDLILPAPDAPEMWSTKGGAYRPVLRVGADGPAVSGAGTGLLSGATPGHEGVKGLHIRSDAAGVNGVLVDGKEARYLIEKSSVELRGAGTNDSAGIAARLLARGGTLVVRGSKIVTYGSISSAATSPNGGRLYVADSGHPAHPFRGIPARDSDLIPPTYSD